MVTKTHTETLKEHANNTEKKKVNLGKFHADFWNVLHVLIINLKCMFNAFSEIKITYLLR